MCRGICIFVATQNQKTKFMTKNDFYLVLHSVIKAPVEQEHKLAAVNALLYSAGINYKTNSKFLSDNIFEDLLHSALDEYGSVEQLFFNEFSCTAMEREFERFGDLADKCLNFGGANCSITTPSGKTYGKMQVELEVIKQPFISALYRQY
jgi:hypothetical protein